MRINLAICRKRIGISQHELAEKMGVTYQTISQYERGKREPKIEQVQRICEALGCTLDEMLSGVDTAPSETTSPCVKNRIREIRKAQGYTQQTLADALGTVKSAVSQWETGYMGMSAVTLCRLADLLNVTTDALLGRASIETNQPTNKGGKGTMKLNDLLAVMDVRWIKVMLPVTPRLNAQIVLDTYNGADLSDLSEMYGEREVDQCAPVTVEGGDTGIMLEIWLKR